MLLSNANIICFRLNASFSFLIGTRENVHQYIGGVNIPVISAFQLFHLSSCSSFQAVPAFNPIKHTYYCSCPPSFQHFLSPTNCALLGGKVKMLFSRLQPNYKIEEHPTPRSANKYTYHLLPYHHRPPSFLSRHYF
jgi:hypothetical protein